MYVEKRANKSINMRSAKANGKIEMKEQTEVDEMEEEEMKTQY